MIYPRHFDSVKEMSEWYRIEKDSWLKNSIKDHIPTVVFKWIQEKRNLSFVSKFISNKGFYIRETSDGYCDLMKRDVLISKFNFKVEFIYK